MFKWQPLFILHANNAEMFMILMNHFLSVFYGLNACYNFHSQACIYFDTKMGTIFIFLFQIDDSVKPHRWFLHSWFPCSNLRLVIITMIVNTIVKTESINCAAKRIQCLYWSFWSLSKPWHILKSNDLIHATKCSLSPEKNLCLKFIYYLQLLPKSL